MVRERRCVSGQEREGHMNRNLPRVAYRPREAAEVTGLSLRFARQDTSVPVAVHSPAPVDPSQILTLTELAERLKVSERWVYEKSRRRCLNPLPCIRIGRYLRFDWTSVSAWLVQRELGADRKS